MKLTILFILTIAFLITGCEKQGNERLIEKAKIEGGTAAEEQAFREKQLLAERSNEMESALSSQQNFYEAHSGHFEGYITKGNDKFKVRISLFPNIPRNKISRVRTPGEVENDLTQLSFNAQIMQWNSENTLSAVGCRIENLRPDFQTGQINIISSDCPISFYLTLTPNEITGTAQPSTNSSLFELLATRIDEATRKRSVK